MGVDVGAIVPAHPCTLAELKGRIVAIDGYNVLYQFIASIRGPDGTPLQDKQGRTTSHLAGFLYRFANLVDAGILPVVVWDGRPPDAKSAIIQKRIERRQKARAEMEEALARGDMATARAKAQQSSRIEPHMVPGAERLLGLLGVPSLHAPSEGEAQAAALVHAGVAHAVGSQDFDALLFGAPTLVRNLTSSGRRKLPGRSVWVDVVPERIELKEALDALGLTREQLVLLGVLVGTDYLPGGVRGIGPKKALDTVRKAPTPAMAAAALKVDAEPLETACELFLRAEVDATLKPAWTPSDPTAAVRFLVDEHGFDETRVATAAERFAKLQHQGRQKSLFEF